MRILVLNWLDRENPQAGGAEIHLHEVFGRLADRGHDVTVLSSGFDDAPARSTLDGMRVLRAGGRYSYGVAAPLYHRRYLRDEVFHHEDGRSGPFDVVVEDLNKVPVWSPVWVNAPVLLLVHHLFGKTAFRQASIPMAAATWLLERPIPVVYRDVPTVAVSESTAKDLVNRGLRPSSIEVIHNGVDVERYRPDPDVRPFPHPTILYLGRLKRYKRIDLILEAVASLRDRDVSCRLLIAGEGDDRSRLEELARRLDIGSRVDFLGWVSEERKLELLRRAWVHVLTSEKEGWGISNLEAGACGTPTVASDSPGLRDSVVEGRTGRLVPHGDVEALADALEALLADPSLRTELGEGARAFAEEHSWDVAADAFEERLRVVSEAG